MLFVLFSFLNIFALYLLHFLIFFFSIPFSCLISFLPSLFSSLLV
jgi:hypothetical protein